MPEPVLSRRPAPFWHRHLEPEERRRVMHDLALVSREHWTWRFVIMLTLSVLVAVMGLLANSAAVVIGAMLLAPLMTPVLGTAASLAMALPRKSSQSAMRVLLASIWCIALAYVASKLALTSADALSAEVEARTRPDLRDLIVALAAGFAGSYATVRSDTSSSLPGVAVAVALVPPLATVGITLEAGNTVWARGALLLYLTNLAAIIFAGIIVFVVTGFVPPRRLAATVPRILAGLFIAVAAVTVISFPLFRASRSAADESRVESEGRAAVLAWLGGSPLSIEKLDLDGNPVVLELSGPVEPPPTDDLEARLSSVLGGNVQVAVFLDETRAPTTTSTTIVTNEERRTDEVAAVVDAWLVANGNGDGNGSDYELNAFALEGSDLVLTVSGLGAAPPIQDLILRLDEQLPGDVIVPTLRWSQLESVPIGEEPPTPLEVETAEVRSVVERWATVNGLLIVDLRFDGETLTVDVEGSEPAPLEPLLAALDRLDVTVDDVQVFFTQRIRLETTTTTAPITTTTTVATTTGSSTTTTSPPDTTTTTSP